MPKSSSSSVRVFYRPFDCQQVLTQLRQRLPALQQRLPLKRVVLFGSCAQNRHTAASDIDLLVVYGGPARENVYTTVKRALGLRGLEPHVYSESEYEECRDMVNRMIREGIVIEPDSS